jgi:hypothetical protein
VSVASSHFELGLLLQLPCCMPVRASNPAELALDLCVYLRMLPTCSHIVLHAMLCIFADHHRDHPYGCVHSEEAVTDSCRSAHGLRGGSGLKCLYLILKNTDAGSVSHDGFKII